jgi:hypothetical protein
VGPLLLTLLLGAAHAAAPEALTPVPDGRRVSVAAEPGELRLFVSGEPAGLITLRRTSDRGEQAPTCAGGGVDLFAPDLAEDPWLIESCARLEGSPPPIPHGPRVRPDDPRGDAPRVELITGGLSVYPAVLDDRGRLRAATWPWRWMHPFAALWAALLVVALPRQGAPWLLAFFGFGVRVAFTPERILMSGDQPYMSYLTATGLDLGAASPSPTWTALLGPLWLMSGRPLDLPHGANLAFSLLSIVALWELVHRWYGPRAAHASALLLAVLPLHVAVSRSESFFTLAALLQVSAALGAERRGYVGPLLALCSVVLLAHLHPSQVVVAAALTAWLGWRTGSVAATAGAAIGAALAGGRLIGWLRTDPTALAAMDLPRLEVWEHPAALTGPGGTLSLSNPLVTPLAVTALALLAAISMPRGQRRFLGLAAACAALATLPYLHLPLPTDIARFQVPAQVWIAAMAGAGWSLLDRRAVRLWIAALLISWGASRAPLGGRRWTWTAEHEALTRALPFVPPLDEVRYRPAAAGSRWQQAWLQLHQRGVWRAIVDEPLLPGQLRWLGRADAGLPPDVCTLDPILVELIDVHNDLVESVDEQRVVVGMFNVSSCEPPPAPPPEPRGDQSTATR